MRHSKKEISFRSLYFSYHLVSLTVKATAFSSGLGINSTLQERRKLKPQYQAFQVEEGEAVCNQSIKQFIKTDISSSSEIMSTAIHMYILFPEL